MIGKIYYLTDNTLIPRYVGITTDTLNNRLSKHKWDSNYTNTHKSNWIKSVGKDNIKIILIEETDLDRLSELEVYYIDLYIKLGYKLTNSTSGGEKLFKHTEETKQKLRDINIGRKHTEESRIKISQVQIGKKRSKESVEKQFETRKLNGVPKKYKERDTQLNEKLKNRVPWNKGLKYKMGPNKSKNNI